MNLQSTLMKTEKGTEEIETRKYKLDARTRALLLVVNGKVTAGDLVKNYDRLGDVPAMLKQLAKAGFIKALDEEGAASGTSAKDVTRELVALIYDVLGPEATPIAAEVESRKTVEQLRAYLNSRREMFNAAMTKPRAEQFWAKVADLLI